MTHPNPAPCADTVLYCVIGRAAPHPIRSWSHDFDDLADVVTSAKTEVRAKAQASGHEVSFLLVQGTGPVIPIDIDALVASKVAAAIAALPLLKPATLEDDDA